MTHPDLRSERPIHRWAAPPRPSTAPAPSDPPPDFGAVEAAVGRQFPALGRACYPAVIRRLYQHVLVDGDCSLIRFERSPVGDPLGPLARLVTDSWDPPAIAGAGLLVVADDGNGGGPLCADLRAATPDHAPIVLWDHDRRTASEPLYDNAEAFLRCAAHLGRGGLVADLPPLGGPGAARCYHWWDEP